MFVQWGRKLQVEITLPGGTFVRLCDYNSQSAGVTLACRVEVVRHLRPEPYTSRISIYNLSEALQAALVGCVSSARQMSYLQKIALQAGRIRVRAGRDAFRFSEICNDYIVDITTPDTGNNDNLTVIEAIDGRLAWDAFFVSEGMTLPSSAVIVSAQLGVPPPPVPDLPTKTVTYNLCGNGQQDAIDTFARLGMTPIWRGDKMVWLPSNGVLTLPAVVLDTIAMRPRALREPNGYQPIRTLHDPLLLTGRQAVYRGVAYRIEECAASLSTFEDDWFADMRLRSLVPGV